MSRRILVTGASGFVVRHALTRLAAYSGEVHAAARAAPRDMPPGIRWHQTDLFDAEARHRLVAAVRPDILLHAAWETRHGRFWTAPENLDWVAATLALAREAAEAGLSRFVGVGTCFEYDAAENAVCREDSTPLKPQTLYGIAKDACRRCLAAFAADAGLSFAWARLFLLYGPDEAPSRLVAHVARCLLAGEPAPIGSGRAVRDFIDARDAGAGLAALALSEVAGPVNVASGRATSVREVAETLGRLAGRPELVRVGALPDRDEPGRLVADTARLRTEVGFDDVRPLETGLAEALAHWRTA